MPQEPITFSALSRLALNLLRFLNDLGQDVYISILASHSGHGSTMIGDSPSNARIAALGK